MIKSLSLTVTGDQKLHCVSCEQRVVRILSSLEGLRQVHADASSQRIDVMFDPAELDASAIAERLAKLGYATETANHTMHSRGQ